MPSKDDKRLCIDNVRHAEYYDMLETFDKLYKQSKDGMVFDNLMDLILSEENICLAYRNIKSNKGSKTQGTDNITIETISKMTKREVIDFVRFIVLGSEHGYRPKPVRRKEIPKPYDTTKMRPLGIPCMWDRIVQQCIKQVMEPICEAKFSANSYGFRPTRSAKNAVRRCNDLMQLTKLHYVIEFDIKGFFDNVNHSKLIRQIWSMGIHDKKLIWIIKKILKAPIKMPNGDIVYPEKGTPQGGVISPLLANIVLNELDHWVESQWQLNPIINKYSTKINSTGSINYGNGYKAMKKTNLKEMYIVRYADDFRIFCRNRNDANNCYISVKKWIEERLKLEISPEKTKIVNMRKRYSEFLGIKMKVHRKSHKYVVESHMSDKALKRAQIKLIEQIKCMSKPKLNKERDEIILYNSMVSGIHDYYKMATHISKDCGIIQCSVRLVLFNRMRQQKGSRLIDTGRKLTIFEQKQYGKSQQLKYAKGSGEPIYPIGYIQNVVPKAIKFTSTAYTNEGRKHHHDKLEIDLTPIQNYVKENEHDKTIEWYDNLISRFSAQWGRCMITGRTLKSSKDIAFLYRQNQIDTKTDKYSNLILVIKPIEELIQSTDNLRNKYLIKHLKLTTKQIIKLNNFRKLLNLPNIG